MVNFKLNSLFKLNLIAVTLVLCSVSSTEARDIEGDRHDNWLGGSSEDDNIRGYHGDDFMWGLAGHDSMFGGAGHDVIQGGLGNDTLSGGLDNDSLFGGKGNDSLYGDEGEDHINGGLGHDLLVGGAGDDILKGEAGDDEFEVGLGSDITYGGLGWDLARFTLRPVDYSFEQVNGKLIVTNRESHELTTLHSIEELTFNDYEGAYYEPTDLLDNSLLADRNDIMLYGDPAQGRIVGVQLSTMEQVFDLPVDGSIVYSSDIINPNKSYVYARGTPSLTVLSRDGDGEFSVSHTIELPFKPRTGAINRGKGVTLLTGSEKAMWALVDINTDSVIAQGGRNEYTKDDDLNHGGHWATGHGVWLTDNSFVISDREARTLEYFEVDFDSLEVTAINTISISSSAHTVIGKRNNGERIYYAVTEGADDARPGLTELSLTANGLAKGREVSLPGDDISIMTSHHAKPLADGTHIYMGSSEGNLYVINRHDMTVVSSITVGKGAGHTILSPSRNIAIVTNHKDTFVSLIDTRTHQKITDITVSEEQMAGTILQSHTTRLSPDGKYFYNFATDNGFFFSIDLDRLIMDQMIDTGGTPIQGSQPM